MMSVAPAGASTGLMDDLPLWVWIVLALAVLGAILLAILVSDARNTLRYVDDVIDAEREHGWTLDAPSSGATRRDPEDPDESAA